MTPHPLVIFLPGGKISPASSILPEQNLQTASSPGIKYLSTIKKTKEF